MSISLTIFELNRYTYLFSGRSIGYFFNVLIDKGANLNMSKNIGCTPLNIASQEGHTDSDNVLLDKGTEVNIAENDGVTP